MSKLINQFKKKSAKIIEKPDRFKEKITVKEPTSLKCNKCGYKTHKITGNRTYLFNEFCFKCVKRKFREFGVGSMVITDD